MSAITEDERIILSQFKENLKDSNFQNDLFKDTLLIRWLRARSMNLTNADSMFRQHLSWRQENKIDAILEKPISEYMQTFYPVAIDGFDKCNNIMIQVDFGAVDFKRVLREFGKETGLEYFYQNLEKAFKKAVVNSDLEIALKRVCLIIDMTGLSYFQFAKVEVLEHLLTGLRQFLLNYPEFLAHAFVIYAPPITSMLYSIMKPLLDHKTREKIMFVGTEDEKVLETLLQYIDKDQLPKKYQAKLKI